MTGPVKITMRAPATLAGCAFHEGVNRIAHGLFRDLLDLGLLSNGKTTGIEAIDLSDVDYGEGSFKTLAAVTAAAKARLAADAAPPTDTTEVP